MEETRKVVGVNHLPIPGKPMTCVWLDSPHPRGDWAAVLIDGREVTPYYALPPDRMSFCIDGEHDLTGSTVTFIR